MQQDHYDYLIVGAGITAAVFAHEATHRGKSCLVIDRRNHIAGNIYTSSEHDINVHKYGAHILDVYKRQHQEAIKRDPYGQSMRTIYANDLPAK